MVLCICTRIALTVLDFLQQLEYHRQTVCTAIAQNADARALANVFGLTKPGTGADTPEHPIWTRQFARISKFFLSIHTTTFSLGSGVRPPVFSPIRKLSNRKDDSKDSIQTANRLRLENRTQSDRGWSVFYSQKRT